MSELASVIFDLDGTLADSERHGHRVAFNRAFEEFDLPDRWDEEHYGRLLKIAGGKERLKRHFGDRGVSEAELDELVPALHAKKNEAFVDLVGEGRIPARPGAVRIVDELGDSGVRLAIATTGTPEWVRPLLDELFEEGRFEVILTAEEVPDKKPDPAVFEVALKHLDVSPDEVLVIEDSAKGLQAAKAIDLACIVVVNDYTKDEDFEGADLVVDGFGEPDTPGREISNPHSVPWNGMLDLAVVREVHARATGG